MEQPTSDSQNLSLTQLLQAKTSCTLEAVTRMDCDRKLGGREKDKDRGFQVIAIAMTAHVRPTFYTH